MRLDWAFGRDLGEEAIATKAKPDARGTAAWTARGLRSGPLEAIAVAIHGHVNTPLYRTAYMLILGGEMTSALGFVFWAVAARRYPPDVVGNNSAAISAMILVSGIAQLGLYAVLVRYLPRTGSAAASFVTRSYVLSGALTAVTAFAIAEMAGRWSPRLAFLAADRTWLTGFVIGATAWTIFSLEDAVIVGVRSAQWVPIENVLYSAAKIVLVLVLAAAMPVRGIFAAWTIPAIVVLVATNILIYQVLLPRHGAAAIEEPRDRRRLLRFASGNYVGSLFATASVSLLPLLVTSRLGAQSTAFFFIPWAITAGVNLVTANMAISLTVETAIDESQLRDHSRRVVVQTLRLVLPVSVILLVAAPYLLRVFGEPYAREGATLLRLLAVATLPKIITELGLAVARIRRDARGIIAIQAAQCIPALALSVVLVPRLGIVGVGLAWLATQTAVALWLILCMLPAVLREPARPVTPGACTAALQPGPRYSAPAQRCRQRRVP